jgi:hypothetical protein
MRVIQAIGHGRRLALLAFVVTITVVATLLIWASTGDTASPRPVVADPVIDARRSPADARTTADVSVLWQLLGRLSSVDGEDLMAGLAPETRAQLGHVAEVIAAAHGWH